MSSYDVAYQRIQKLFRAFSFEHKMQYLVMSKIKNLYNECEGRIEKSVPRITVCHHSASLVMPNGDPQDRFFYPPLTVMVDSYNMGNSSVQKGLMRDNKNTGSNSLKALFLTLYN